MEGEARYNLKGLYTDPNPFGAVPEGALTQADEVVFRSDGLLEMRYGFTPATLQTFDTESFTSYQSKFVAASSTQVAYYVFPGGWTALAGTFTSIATGYLKRFCVAQQNLYFTTSTGVYRMAAYNSTPVISGLPRPLNSSGVVTAGTFLPDASSVAYRIAYTFTDLNSNLHTSAVSPRFVVTNAAGGARDVQITHKIPSGLTTSYVLEVYRSATVDSTVEPNDDLQLVYSAHLTAGQIAAGQVVLTDSQPEELRGQTLYTSPSQEGIEANNDAPPLARDMAVFRNCAWYADTQTKQQLFTTMIAVPALAETLTLAGVTYTARAAENIALNEYQRFTAGTVSQNIVDTCASLCNVINRSASNTLVYAYYISGYDDLPGQLLIESRSLGASAFTQAASAGSQFSWSPSLDATQTSSNETRRNRVCFSKPQQPEAVPLAYYFDVGDPTQNIKRIVPLRDSLMVFKEDGIFRIVGDSVGNFAVSLLDSTASIRGRETAATLNNQVYCLSTQGVIAANESGVQIVSRPIEQDLIGYMIDVSDTEFIYCCGAASEFDRTYYLGLRESSGSNAEMFRWNTLSGQWTHSAQTGNYLNVVSEGGSRARLVMTSVSRNLGSLLLEERDPDGSSRYFDVQYDISITGGSGTTLTMTSTANVLAGDLIYDATSGAFATVATVDTGTQVTLVSAPSVAFANGGAWSSPPIQAVVKFAPFAFGAPHLEKSFKNLLLTFTAGNFTSGKYSTVATSLTTNLAQTATTATMTPLGTGETVTATNFPLEKSRGNWTSVSVTLTAPVNNVGWKLAGVAVLGAVVSERKR